MTELSESRKTVSLSASATSSLAALKGRFPFSQDFDAARVGIAFAVAQSITPDRPAGFGPLGETTWNVGSLDPSGNLKELMRSLWPGAGDPYMVLETLMNLGLVELGKYISENPAVRFSDLLEVSAPTTG